MDASGRGLLQSGVRCADDGGMIRKADKALVGRGGSAAFRASASLPPLVLLRAAREQLNQLIEERPHPW